MDRSETRISKHLLSLTSAYLAALPAPASGHCRAHISLTRQIPSDHRPDPPAAVPCRAVFQPGGPDLKFSPLKGQFQTLVFFIIAYRRFHRV